MKCYAAKCPLPPTMGLAVRNHISNRWTSGELTYCTEHAARAMEAMQQHGLETRLTDLEVSETKEHQ